MKKLTLFTLFISVYFFGQIEKDTLDLSEYPNKFILSSKINETSGVEYFDNNLYTFNDSGGKPEIYKLNSGNGNIIQTIKINGAENVDWEEIARKGDTLFIGDFGNNLGLRKDLTIYSILLPKDNSKEETEVNILDSFRFTFEDQTEFENRGPIKTNYDCEAFIYYRNKLHLFTKRWRDNYTTHYELELQSSNKTQIAKKVEIFNTECLITGADIYNDDLYLIGYTKIGSAYVWKFSQFLNDKFFNGKAKKILIGLTAAIGQTEGIAITNDKIYITREEMIYSLFSVKPMLYILNRSEL